MHIGTELEKALSLAASRTPEPERARRSLLRLVESVEDAGPLINCLSEAGMLFSYSRFLLNYCIRNPEALPEALKEIDRSLTRDYLIEAAAKELRFDDAEAAEAMRSIRAFRNKHILRATLRDILGKVDISASMEELSALAEVIIETALDVSLRVIARRFGEPGGGVKMAIIGLGKLGGEELNYSSDVDLIAVYDSPPEGMTSGVAAPSGVRNRITAHEFYTRAVETMSKILSANTEDGIAYRVDLRLRPQGQKGELALHIDSYRDYYRTWGRTWERMVLIRARPVAGDPGAARAFTDVIEPFLWRRTLDYSDIEEIRAMKKKIDTAISAGDIKRGYGGIREVEFFVNTFQLIYGADEPTLRTHRLLNAMQALRRLGLVPEKELITLRENYLYLRRLEHYLQMEDDVQTHRLPESEEEIAMLARKFGAESERDFLAALGIRRRRIKMMYNSLLGTKEDVHSETLSLLEDEFSDDELKAYLSDKGIIDSKAALMDIKGLREFQAAPGTPAERAALRETLPELIESAFEGGNPGGALRGINNFFSGFGLSQSYLTALKEDKVLKETVLLIFAHSKYLSRVLLSSPVYLNALIEEPVIRKTLRRTLMELRRHVKGKESIETATAEYKNAEEVRLGGLFLGRTITTENLLRYLSHLAEASVAVLTEMTSPPDIPLAVIALGKLGGREMTFGSDLDLLFVSESGEAAESVLKTLGAYTERGLLYSADMRLRPDGSRGALVKDIEGFRRYYKESAQPWEIQALLRARPVGGDTGLAEKFMGMARKTIEERGGEVKAQDVAAMRKRIVRELSLESKGIDIKLGQGGIEEIEFYVQMLELRHSLNIQSTMAAMRLLSGWLNRDMRPLISAYEYMRRLETFMRLNEESVVEEGGDFAALAARFMGHKGMEEFIAHLGGLRRKVLDIVYASK